MFNIDFSFFFRDEQSVLDPYSVYVKDFSKKLDSGVPLWAYIVHTFCQLSPQTHHLHTNLFVYMSLLTNIRNAVSLLATTWQASLNTTTVTSTHPRERFFPNCFVKKVLKILCLHPFLPQQVQTVAIHLCWHQRSIIHYHLLSLVPVAKSLPKLSPAWSPCNSYEWSEMHILWVEKRHPQR